MAPGTAAAQPKRASTTLPATHALAAAQRKQSALSDVKWRFLADEREVPSSKPQTAPWTYEARQRIHALEQALAESHSLEAESKCLASLGHEPTPLTSTWSPLRKGGLTSLVNPLAAGRTQSASGRLHPPPYGDAEPSHPTLVEDMIPSDPLSALPTYPVAIAPHVPSRRAPPSAVIASRAPRGDDDRSESEADREVSRLQQMALANANNASDDESRNTPSPVIIWRHASPVKLATNVPADLLPPDQFGQASSSNSARSPVHAPNSPGWGSSASPARKASPSKKKIYGGAWYMPVDMWSGHPGTDGSDMSGGANLNSTDPRTRAQKLDGGGSRSGRSGHSDKDAAVTHLPSIAGATDDAAEVIPKLYSSRMYKEYLKEKRVHRIPHYLSRDDSTSHARRGASSENLMGANAGPAESAS